MQSLFAADDGTTGIELWRTDGVTVIQVADIEQTTANLVDLEVGVGLAGGTTSLTSPPTVQPAAVPSRSSWPVLT